MITLAAIGAAATYAIPRLTYSCVGNNEPSAWAALRTIAYAESQFQAAADVDRDGDRRGEFGTLAEMSGAVALAGHDAAIKHALLSGAYRRVCADGTITRSGYRFRVFLPDARGDGVCETAVSGDVPGRCGDPSVPRGPVCPSTRSERVDSRLASQRWCAYAWPVTYGASGNRTFFIDQDGNELCTEEAHYSGDDGPAPGAAFASGGIMSILGAIPADGMRSQDGNVWRDWTPR